VFRRSPDAGITWEDARKLNSAPTAFIPVLAYGGGGDIYVAWTDEREVG